MPPLPSEKTATAKPPPVDGQNYGESAGVVAAMSTRGLVWTVGGCAVRRRPENSGGAGGGAGREREGQSVGRGGLLVSPTGGRRGGGGTRACVAAVCSRPFHPKPSATLGRDGSKTDGFRTFVRLRPRVEPRNSSVLSQTDAPGQDGIAPWSWPNASVRCKEYFISPHPKKGIARSGRPVGYADS